MNEKRLFLNLTTEPFLDFKERGKKYEIRAYGRASLTEESIKSGRRVELRKAYNRGSLWGQVGQVIVGSIEKIFNRVDYKLIEPRATSKEQAIQENKDLLKNPERYIAFEIILDD